MDIGSLLQDPYQVLVEEIHKDLARKGHADIRPAHASVFRFIGKNGARITAMARKAHMTKQSMSYLVYYLEERGYVEQGKDSNDKRAIIFKLTKKGRKVSESADKTMAQVQRRWEKQMGKKEYRRMCKALEELHKAVA